VRIQIIGTPPATAAAVATVDTDARYAVQVGAFRDKKTAERVKEEMAGRYGSAKLVPRPGNPMVWRVLVGAESSEDGAGGLADKIRKEGGDRTSAFVVRLDS
jgi:cell division protein FtsN